MKVIEELGPAANIIANTAALAILTSAVNANTVSNGGDLTSLFKKAVPAAGVALAAGGIAALTGAIVALTLGIESTFSNAEMREGFTKVSKEERKHIEKERATASAKYREANPEPDSGSVEHTEWLKGFSEIEITPFKRKAQKQSEEDKLEVLRSEHNKKRPPSGTTEFTKWLEDGAKLGDKAIPDEDINSNTANNQGMKAEPVVKVEVFNNMEVNKDENKAETTITCNGKVVKQYNELVS